MGSSHSRKNTNVSVWKLSEFEKICVELTGSIRKLFLASFRTAFKQSFHTNRDKENLVLDIYEFVGLHNCFLPFELIYQFTFNDYISLELPL